MIEQVKGTRNIHSEDAQVYLFILNSFLNTFNSYGYEYTELPIIEHKELFTKSIGESSEIVTKQMYEFIDKGDRELVLRPEGTASVVSSIKMTQKNIHISAKCIDMRIHKRTDIESFTKQVLK